MTDAEITYLSRAQVEHIVEQIDPVEQVRKALIAHAHGNSLLPDEAVMRWRTEEGDEARSLVLQGMLNYDPALAGLKVINANPGNVRSGQRRASGITMLFDSTTARINALMEAAVISALRTAAVSALGVEACASKPPSVVALIGTGELCRAHARVFLKQFPSITQIRFFDIEIERARRAVADLVGDGVDASRLVVVDSAEAGVRGADVVSPTTTVTEAYILLDWISPGATLVNVSLDDFEAAVISAAETVVVDDWNLIVDDDRRLLGRMQRDGRFVWRGDDDSFQAHSHLGQVLAGEKPGRLTEDGIAYVNPFGLAIDDVAVAHAVHDYALANGIGTKLPL